LVFCYIILCSPLNNVLITLSVVSTYKAIAPILTLYLLCPPVMSIMGQHRHVQDTIVTENIKSYSRYFASICYELVICICLVHALRLHHTIAVYYHGPFCLKWWDFTKLVISPLFQLPSFIFFICRRNTKL
jgi:hypothetical protein